MQGWIKLHRKIKNHWIYQEKRTFSRYEAWIDLLMMANHKDNKTLIDGKLVNVKKGQFITSIRNLCNKWNWSNTKVNNFLGMLEQDEMVIAKSDTKKTVITIVNYSVYHDEEDDKTTQKHHGNDSQKQDYGKTSGSEGEKNDTEKTGQFVGTSGIDYRKEIKKHHRNDTETSQKHYGDIQTRMNKNVKNDKEIKNSRKRVYDESSIYFILAKRLYDRILENNPNHKKPNLQNWANDIRLMMERDKRTEKQIIYVIDWCQKNSFWKSNILSVSKLREKFDQLVMQIKSNKEKVVEIPNYEVKKDEGINGQHPKESGNVRLFR